MLDYIKTVLNGINKLVDSKIVNPDWNVNDPEGPAYVKNRTHYEITESKVIEKFARDLWDLESPSSLYYQSQLPSPEGEYIYGDKYTIVYDGIPYEVECVEAYNYNDLMYVIGFGIIPNKDVFDPNLPHPSGKTPFVLMQTFKSALGTRSEHAIGEKVKAEFNIWVLRGENPTPHTFEIRHEKTTIKQLDKKYMPLAVKLTYTYIVETNKYIFCKIEDGVATEEEVTPQEIYEWWSIEEREIMLVSKENAAVKHTVTGISHIKKSADSSVTSLRIYSSAFGGEPWVKVG